MLYPVKKFFVRTSFVLNVILIVGVTVFIYAANPKISGHITAGNDAFAKSITQEDTRVDEAAVMADPTANAAQQPVHVPGHKPKVK